MKETGIIMKDVEVTYRLTFLDLVQEEYDQECEFRAIDEQRFLEYLEEKRERPDRFVNFKAAKVTITREVEELDL